MTTQTELFRSLSKPWQPHAYQKKAVKFLLEHACAALFLDPGLGKTSIVLAAIKFLKARGIIKKVLVIAPRRACHLVWVKELALWTDFHGLKMEVLHGPDKDAALRRKADIYVINHEGLAWLLSTKKVISINGTRTSVNVDVKQFERYGFDTLVMDELSKFKHPKTLQFKALKKVLHTFKRRWGLTGSPSANGLLDLFGQCYMLDMGNALGAYITHFRGTYFTPVDRLGFKLVLQRGAEERIYERLAPLVLRMAAEDYLALPEHVSNIITVDLPAEAMKVYQSLDDELFTQINEKIVTATNAGVASMKCRQLAAGGIYIDPMEQLGGVFKKSRDWEQLHTAKIDALAELIEELQGAPLLVGYDFQHDLARIRKRFGADAPVIGGGTSDKEAARLEHAWNAGELPVLFGHPQSMGHGLNLQGAGHHVCWLTLTWNYELYDQFIRRVLRQGNKHARVFVHHIIARGTVDEAVLGALRSKETGQRALFDALKVRQKERLK